MTASGRRRIDAASMRGEHREVACTRLVGNPVRSFTALLELAAAPVDLSRQENSCPGVRERPMSEGASASAVRPPAD